MFHFIVRELEVGEVHIFRNPGKCAALWNDSIHLGPLLCVPAQQDLSQRLLILVTHCFKGWIL